VLLIDGRVITSTGKNVLQGTYGGWIKLAPGPHTVKFRAMDSAGNVQEQEFVVNKVGFGDGEAIATKLSLGVYGRGPTRLAVAKIFTTPSMAAAALQGKLSIRYERRTARGWKALGRASSASVAKLARISRKLKPGKYRAIVEFPGFKSFKPAVQRKYFVVR
jgi:hypothetical protein